MSNFAVELSDKSPTMEWTENIIIADGDYIDSVAFNLTVNFERMLGRRIPPADMARWAECIALDGGLRPEKKNPDDKDCQTSVDGSPLVQTTVAIVHAPGKTRLENFVPGVYAGELDGKAFSGNLGEFVFSTPTAEGLASSGDLFLDIVQMALDADGVKRIMIVPGEQDIDAVRQLLRRANDRSKTVTLFAMQPVAGGPFCQEILGYSLMAALGVKSSELHPDL